MHTLMYAGRQANGQQADQQLASRSVTKPGFHSVPVMVPRRPPSGLRSITELSEGRYESRFHSSRQFTGSSSIVGASESTAEPAAADSMRIAPVSPRAHPPPVSTTKCAHEHLEPAASVKATAAFQAQGAPLCKLEGLVQPAESEIAQTAASLRRRASLANILQRMSTDAEHCNVDQQNNSATTSPVMGVTNDVCMAHDSPLAPVDALNRPTDPVVHENVLLPGHTSSQGPVLSSTARRTLSDKALEALIAVEDLKCPVIEFKHLQIARKCGGGSHGQVMLTTTLLTALLCMHWNACCCCPFTFFFGVGH